MTLFDAQPYDAARSRKKWLRIAAIVGAVIALAVVWWNLRFWPEEHMVDQFFDALQQQKLRESVRHLDARPGLETASRPYSRYPYNDFIKDWGPSGEWGIIKSHHIDGAAVPSGYSGSPFATASGVVVVVTVNDRVADKAHIWVQKDDKTLGFSPY